MNLSLSLVHSFMKSFFEMLFHDHIDFMVI